LRNALGQMPWPKEVPDWLYRLSWALLRVHSDFHLIHVLHLISRPFVGVKPLTLTKLQQWLATGLIVILAGAPFTPLSHFLEEELMELLKTHPVLAFSLTVAHFSVSVVLIRFLFLNILDARRFHISHQARIVSALQQSDANPHKAR